MNQYDSSYISYLRQNKSEENLSEAKNVLYLQMLLIIASCLLSICIYLYSTTVYDVTDKKMDDNNDRYTPYHTGYSKDDYTMRHGRVVSRV